MKRTIILIAVLCLILCGCSSEPPEEFVPETTTPSVIQEYKTAAYSNLGFSFSNAIIHVHEKDGRYRLSVNVVDFKNIDFFPKYVLLVKDAFEKTIPIDCADRYDLWFVDPYSDHYVSFSSFDYETDPLGVSGVFSDCRQDEPARYKITSEEDWSSFFPLYLPEVSTKIESVGPEDTTPRDDPSAGPSSLSETEAETNSQSSTYTLNTNSRKFHYSWCDSAKKTKASNKSSFTGTRDEAISKGYDPCQICNP